MAEPDIGIIIVNWNTRDYLKRCLESVYASDSAVSYKVVVVDNASDDDSVDMVRSTFPQATVVDASKNLGYSAGNNQGLRAFGFSGQGQTMTMNTPRYVLLLNPDTELPRRALADLVAYMDLPEHEKIGVIGPKLVLNDGSLDLACRRSFPTPEVALWKMIGFANMFPSNPRFARYNLTFLDEDETTEVDSVVGAFMLIRRKALLLTGLMDEEFFMYGEDLDLNKRIKENGWKILYYPNVEVKHVKRAASRQSGRAQFEFVRAMLIFYRKHYRRETSFPMHLAVMAGLALRGGPRLWPELLNPAA